MPEAEIQKLILSEIRDIKEVQNYHGKQLTDIVLRLGIIEYDCKALTNRVDSLNGCTSELASELDEIVGVEECKNRIRSSRKEKIYMACKIIGAIGVIGGLIIAIIL